jgi:cytochrome c-type biogenesis protein CcmH
LSLSSLTLLAAALTSPAVVTPQQPPARGTDSAVVPGPSAETVTRANQLIGGIMSPFCPGLTLANCPSTYAETLRVSVRARVQAGESPDSIVEALVAAFGEGIRGAPRARGLGLVLWAGPFVAIALGAIGVTWWLRARGVPGRSGPMTGDRGAGVPRPSPAELARLEEALRRYG